VTPLEEIGFGHRQTYEEDSRSGQSTIVNTRHPVFATQPPRFEIAHRHVVPATELLVNLWMEQGFEPIYHRTLVEAGLV
jgi:hypothetical protein